MLHDASLVGVSLHEEGQTSFAAHGAHDPTSSHYFVLKQLFSRFNFTEESHLLDVGCGLGRVLAFFHEQQYPGKATGVEIDKSLALQAEHWAQRFPELSVICSNVLTLSLRPYTHMYLFNPFDSRILVQFLNNVERDVTHPLELIHMSDNGETYYFAERPCWHLVEQGEFQRIEDVVAFQHPQHWSKWAYTPGREQL